MGRYHEFHVRVSLTIFKDFHHRPCKKFSYRHFHSLVPVYNKVQGPNRYIMSQLQMPYQCVVNSSDILIAARGSSIDLFSLKDGSLASTWDCPASQETKKEKSTLEAKVPSAKPLASQEEGDVEDSAPPAKKRKLSTQSSTEIVTDSNLKANGSAKDVDAGGKKKKQSNRAAAVTSGLEAPAVIALAATTTGSHVIAVTGEDKTIRVFEIKKDGTPCLVQISRR